MNAAPDGANLHRASPATSRPCVVCGRVLVSPYWIATYPDGEHEACRDWTAGYAFPWARQVNGLRRLRRETRGEQRAALGRVGVALVALEQRWPGDALAVLGEGRDLIAEARRAVVDLEPRMRGLL